MLIGKIPLKVKAGVSPEFGDSEKRPERELPKAIPG